jgi:drug/metabolite transporter (DMT)-like permease
MNTKTVSWLLLILLALLWGSSFILMEKSMFDADHNPLFTASQVASLRIFIATIAILPFALKSLKLLFTKNWVFFLLVGLLGNFIPAFLFTFAKQDLSSSFTGILNSLVPIFSILVTTLVFKHELKKLSLLGVIIGFIGTFLLIIFSSNDVSQIKLIPILLVVFATVCYAFSLNIIKEKLADFNSITITAVSLLSVSIPSLFIILSEDTIQKIQNPVYLEAFIYIIILSVICTTFALVVFNHLIKLSTSTFASSVTYLIPIVALLWGAYFGENIPWSIVFIVVIILGIFLVRKGEKS